MEIKSKQFGTIIYVTFNGKFDCDGEKKFVKDLKPISMNDTFDIVIFDFTKVFSITSTAIGKIYQFYKMLDKKEKLFEIIGVNNPVYRPFKDTNIQNFFPIFKDKKSKYYQDIKHFLERDESGVKRKTK